MSNNNADRQWSWRQRRKDAGLSTHPYRSAAEKKIIRERYKQRNPDKVKAGKKRYKAAHMRYKLPFAGCDGEGAGKDDLGRQLYMLFRMGDRELYTSQPLTTDDILEFICNAPKMYYYVGFSFGYDVTMILRDLSDEAKRKLFRPRVWSKGFSPYVWYGQYEVDYLPRQFLRVRRVRIIDGKPVPVKSSVRVIYETFGFFQKSFLKVLEQFSIGSPEQRKQIAVSKAGRGTDTWTIDDRTREYCALECDMLANTMEKLRDNCFAAGIRPMAWTGAGKIAKALHASNRTPKMADLDIPPEAADMASMAYYGGRFEVTRIGLINQQVHEYDIRSAYPSAMLSLPCLVPQHGHWFKATDKELRSQSTDTAISFSIASVSFAGFGKETAPLPIRSREGHLYWPKKGRGIYFSCEVESALRSGYDIHYHTGWTYVQTCKCRPFEWVYEMYEYRRSIGSSDQGYPIKLGLNALYGALAQRVGSGRYANLVWAGLITASLRSLLNDVAQQSPSSVIMFATDAIYSTKPLDVPIGEQLGQWEHSILEDMFIVQPGLYWDRAKTKHKSRGLSGKFFEEKGRIESFENAWFDYLAARNSQLDVSFPVVPVPVTNFIGLRLAASRGKNETAGRWQEETRELSFDPRRKRDVSNIEGEALLTTIKNGSYQTFSMPHRDFIKSGGAEAWDRAKLEFDEQPDYVDTSAPFEL